MSIQKIASLREFLRHDWLAHSGATRGADGREPWIAERTCSHGTTFTVIADAVGVHVERLEADGREAQWWSLELEALTGERRAQDLSLMIAKGMMVGTSLAPGILESAGFTHIGGADPAVVEEGAAPWRCTECGADVVSDTDHERDCPEWRPL